MSDVNIKVALFQLSSQTCDDLNVTCRPLAPKLSGRALVSNACKEAH